MVADANVKKDKVAKEENNPEKALDLQPTEPKELPGEVGEILKTKGVVISVKERTASTLAKILVFVFLVLLAVPYLYLLRGNVTDAIDLMKTVAATLSGLVGAVFGYYFRKGE